MYVFTVPGVGLPPLPDKLTSGRDITPSVEAVVGRNVPDGNAMGGRNVGGKGVLGNLHPPRASHITNTRMDLFFIERKFIN